MTKYCCYCGSPLVETPDQFWECHKCHMSYKFGIGAWIYQIRTLSLHTPVPKRPRGVMMHE